MHRTPSSDNSALHSSEMSHAHKNFGCSDVGIGSPRKCSTALVMDCSATSGAPMPEKHVDR
eukprot:6513667-Pyramimonas_sp.AAC.1